MTGTAFMWVMQSLGELCTGVGVLLGGLGVYRWGRAVSDYPPGPQP